MTILYEKVGRRYKPVMTDDWKYQSSIPKSERQASWAGSINDGLQAAMSVLEDRLLENGKK